MANINVEVLDEIIHCIILECTSGTSYKTKETTLKREQTNFDQYWSHNKTHRHTKTQLYTKIHHHMIAENVTTRKVTKSSNIKATKKLKQEITELMVTETELMESLRYLHHSVSPFNDSRHKYDPKRSGRNLGDYSIFKPNPPILAIIANKSPRLFNLFRENHFHPSSAMYWTVSIYTYIYDNKNIDNIHFMSLSSFIENVYRYFK